MLNRDLFGDLIPETPKETPVSVRPRMNTVAWHSSDYLEPPHGRPHPRHDSPSSPYSSNQSNEIIHAGTPGAARHRGIFRVLHMYEIPKHLMDVIHRDSDNPSSLINEGPPQQSLWEYTDKPAHAVAESNMVTPYLNQYEDRGSVSYMIPKHLINSGQVKYLGIDNP